MKKISKTQFLELVELSIAALGLEELYSKGSRVITQEQTLDDAIAEYVYWTYDRGIDGGIIGPVSDWSESYEPILYYWTHDDEQSN